MQKPKVAVITPYCKEPPEKLARCMASVEKQTYKNITHYLVADGHPYAELPLSRRPLRHIVLPVSHADNGNTPRGIGAICALNEDAEIFCFLDADNLFEPNHVESAVSLLVSKKLDAVFSYRRIFLPDAPDLRLVDDEDLAKLHVDTSCISLSKSAAFLLPAWAMMPKAMSPICDRVFSFLMQHHRLNFTWTEKFTVLFESNYAVHYRRAGYPVPDNVHRAKLSDIWEKYSDRECLDRLRLSLRG